ncbi:phospholipid scramblase 1-like isoform X2 [Gigantopelta aegis]|nr:phospholipid scramblase 1-like isoform X2 [Gigantopelta aegis]XP_041378177.1 phospholipid scramblase 1-like isoform X2 [Gigantopelta aegis]
MEKAPVVTQPKKEVQWMSSDIVDVPDGCPIGLEYLIHLDQLLVRQEAHFLEVLMEWECANKYRIMNSFQQQVFYATEESDICMIQCCGPRRAFVIHITDNLGQEVLRFIRKFKSCGGCCCCANNDCAAHEVKVQAIGGNVLGYVRQLQSGWSPHFGIFDSKRKLLFESWGPCCPCQSPCCTSDVTFPFRSIKDGQIVATIAKQWAGAAQELFTDADNYGVSFPADMQVEMKAVLLGAVFLIDFMYFEHKENQHVT